MIAASLALFVLAQTKPPEAGFRVWMGPSGPRAPVRYSRPTLSWQIWTDDPARSVVGVLLSVNGRPVPAK